MENELKQQDVFKTIIQLRDREGDKLLVTESEDYLCYIETGDINFGVSPHHAHKIIEALTELLKKNKI